MDALEFIVKAIRQLHEIIRDEVVTACEKQSPSDLSKVDHESFDDTIYSIDRVSEDRIVDFFERNIAPQIPVVLIAEGLGKTGKRVMPESISETEAMFRIIMDPIDGTRGLMYQKRSAWILTGVAPNKGPDTNLTDIEFALQTEIPLVKQHLSDMLWAYKGRGAKAARFNRITKIRAPLTLTPSTAGTIAHGFSTIARFFPGGRDILAKVDDDIVRSLFGEIVSGKAQCFEDQYLSSGGQLYELMCGHDRFIADLRPLLEKLLAKRGISLGLCCHPYDICTELIARELGVIVTDPFGNPLKAKLNVTEGVSWAGYANAKIEQLVSPVFKKVLEQNGLL